MQWRQELRDNVIKPIFKQNKTQTCTLVSFIQPFSGVHIFSCKNKEMCIKFTNTHKQKISKICAHVPCTCTRTPTPTPTHTHAAGQRKTENKRTQTPPSAELLHLPFSFITLLWTLLIPCYKRLLTKSILPSWYTGCRRDSREPRFFAELCSWIAFGPDRRIYKSLVNL